jgi:hypothetical protein
MSPEELNDWKTKMQAVIDREQSTTGRTAQRFATEWMNGTADHPRNPRPLAAPSTTEPRQLSEREQLLADGFAFTVQEQQRQHAEADHRDRRRRATEAREQQERTWRRIRDAQGLDAADAWLRGQG